MAVNLTLNDFRSVLGNVNDGNVVFKQDQSGIEKANYGNKLGNVFRSLFSSVRTAPVSTSLPDEPSAYVGAFSSGGFIQV